MIVFASEDLLERTFLLEYWRDTRLTGIKSNTMKGSRSAKSNNRQDGRQISHHRILLILSHILTYNRTWDILNHTFLFPDTPALLYPNTIEIQSSPLLVTTVILSCCPLSPFSHLKNREKSIAIPLPTPSLAKDTELPPFPPSPPRSSLQQG